MKETYLTAEGLQELQEKLHELKTVRRRDIAEAIHSAKEQGDLSENAEYVNAKEEQRRIETQIAELEAAIKHAQVVTVVGTSSVGVGNTVRLKCNGKELTYRIVGSSEADPMEAKISNESPMGRALLGKKKGESVTIPTPAGDKECTVIAIA
ncbi:MAG: transcription elongation factor GreA [Candidatus Andersenbacteria bacterium CG10_big_fil_rev_8_21_14_0_10_54_11]|uniref:Transcription elongation factor GreA n=1 Tax=Candidatus Andersenbacteria bacterium CG10_big_fil_rev_8_21_14_0_10_54_11 TaxID=1974485 RepID=A0A2M6WYH9_9BACT|nr:MAG: transcription elongation factor GreA [Candidatus Andersenbacteria bacterium CG10_big_fil_rev_8_21_14_0_10_54_11]